MMFKRIQLDGSWSLGPKGPPRWSGQKYSSNFGTVFPHYRPARPNQGLFSSQNKTGGLPVWYLIVLGFEKYSSWRLIFHLFGTPFADFLLGKWVKMGCLAKKCSVLPHFCCNDVFYWYVDDSYKNDTNQVSGWWDVTDLWWKVGFTPRAIRHVHFYWQLSSLGVQSTTSGNKV
jgi:hypothetical protein